MTPIYADVINPNYPVLNIEEGCHLNTILIFSANRFLRTSLTSVIQTERTMLFLAVTRDKMETTLAAWERGTGTKISMDYMGTVIVSDGPNDKANINSMGRVIHK